MIKRTKEVRIVNNALIIFCHDSRENTVNHNALCINGMPCKFLVSIRIGSLLKSPTLLFEFSVWLNDKMFPLNLTEIQANQMKIGFYLNSD